MPTVYEIDRFMSEWAPPSLSESWDNDGIMLCGNVSQTVKKVTVCLEINEHVAKLAAENGSELIITHHPYIFRPLKSIRGTDYDIASVLIGAGVSVLSYHTRLDAAEGGVNDALSEKLGLSEVFPFVAESQPIGRVGKLKTPMKPEEFGNHIKKSLGVQSMRCAVPDTEKLIKTVALVGGGGKDFVYAASRFADAYVTSDLSHNALITANECGICVFDAGHYHTENPVTEKIAEKHENAFPELETTVCDSLCPYVIM